MLTSKSQFFAESENFSIELRQIGVNRIRENVNGPRQLIKLVVSGCLWCKDGVERLVFARREKIFGVVTISTDMSSIETNLCGFTMHSQVNFSLVASAISLENDELSDLKAIIWTKRFDKYEIQLPKWSVREGEVDGIRLPIFNRVDMLEPKCIADLVPVDDESPLNLKFFVEGNFSEPLAAPNGWRSNKEEFKSHIDSPAIQNSRVIDPITGSITVSGWALARYEIKSVAVHFDDELIGYANLGIRRQDIADAFPDWPNSLMSGFSQHVPKQLLKDGHKNLKITLTDTRGIRHVEIIDVDVKKVDESDVRPLRRKVSVVETDTDLKIIGSAEVESGYFLFMNISGNVTDVNLIMGTLESLVKQTYKNWSLCILTDGDKTKADLSDALKNFNLNDQNKIEIINVVDCTSISMLIDSSSLSFGRHRFFVQIHPGDQLAIDCLMRVTVSSVGQLHNDFIYGDELCQDKVDGIKRPFLKPEWSPELLLSMNYVGRLWFASEMLMEHTFLSVIDLVRASTYERVLRLTENADSVFRVPSILSERFGDNIENNRTDMLVLQQAAERRNIKANIEVGLVKGSYHFSRKLLRPVKVSIVIPTIASRDLIKVCIESIRRSDYQNYEIIIVDNILEVESEWKLWFRSNADKVIEVPDKFNWSLLNNIGASSATGEFLVFLNDDIEIVDARWLDTLIAIAQDETVGVVGPLLLYPNRTVQHAGIFLTETGGRHAFRFLKEDDPGYFGLAMTQRNVIGVTGACMLMRREVFDELGGFDIAHSVVNNDLDFCLRCNKAGLQVVYTPYTRLIHHELASRKLLPDDYDDSKFNNDWASILTKGDPYYNPGLKLNDDTYLVDSEPIRLVYSGYPIEHRDSIKRILLVKLDHIGDFITSLPAIRRIKALFPNASISLLVSPAVAFLARHQEVIDNVFEFSFFHARSGLGQNSISEVDLYSLKARLKNFQFDLAVDLRKHLDTRHILQYTGARYLAGYDRDYKFPWLNIALEWEGDPIWINKRQHVASDLINLVDAISNACEVDRTIFHYNHNIVIKFPSSIVTLANQIYSKKVVGIHPASGNLLRQWPVEHFASLIDLLIERLSVHVVILGGHDEQALSELILDRVRCRQGVWSLVGKHNLDELPDVLCTLALFVGNNSGPQHIAAGLGVPTVAIHSAVISTEEWGPLGPNAVAIRKDVNCAPCYRSSIEQCHRDIACLREIRPEAVYELCHKFLTLENRMPH